VRTLFVAYRITDRARSVEFYAALGYRTLGSLEFDDGGSLTMLKLPEDPVVTMELVHRPAAGPVDTTTVDHVAIQVDDLAGTREELVAKGITAGPIEYPGGPDGPRIAWLKDPDGYRIELVQWPPGHHWGMTEADFGEQG
jgi:lactoylglutathione lyase